MNENEKLYFEDGASRETIRTQLDRNLFVEASAGSGKTYSLVERMLSMVKAGLDIRKICAITFTKAAANEFRRRFQQRLMSSLREDTLTETEAERCRAALEEIDLCFTGTIDSFCNMLLREHPVEAGIPGTAAVNTDAVLQNAWNREFQRAANGQYGQTLQQKYRALCRWQSNPEAVVQNSVGRLLELRSTQLVCPQPAGTDPEQNYAAELQALREFVSFILEHPEYVYTGNKDSKAAYALLTERARLLQGSWSAKLPDVLQLLGRLKKLQIVSLPENAGSWHPELFIYAGKTKKALCLDFENPSFVYNLLKEEQYAVTMDFLTDFAEACAQTLQANGELSYFDFLFLLRNMLRKDAAGDGKLIQHIYERHSYYLIDEFQDTNPLQAEIFFYLCAQTPREHWYDCIPRAGSLFVVGDPKQSIYRFRGADVASYFNVRRLFERNGGQLLTLYRNFRSTAEFCEGTNAAFSELLPEETENQSSFQPIPIMPEQSAAGTGWYSYRSNMQDFAGDTAALIHRLLSCTDCLIPDGEGGMRRIRYGDIMVITRGKSALKKLLPVFREQQIPCRTEGSTMFGECALLQLLSRLLTGISDPGNSAKLFGALTCGAFPVDERTVLDWCAAGNRLTTWPTPEGEHPVAAALNCLRDYSRRLRMAPASSVCRQLICELRLPAVTGADNLEYALYALELLQKAECSGEVITAKDCAALLAQIAADASDTERCFGLQQDDNRVHLANLHKVKGLEAPVVILSGPRKAPLKAEQHADLLADTPDTVIFTLAGKQTYTYAETKRYEERRELEKANLQAEELRLLYVAATRGGRFLLVPEILTGKKERSKSNFWNPLLSYCVGDISELLPEEYELPNAPEQMLAAELLEEAEQQSLYAQFDGSEISYSEVQPSRIKLKTRHARDAAQEETDAVSADPSVHRHAALLGTLVHKLMEILVSSGTQEASELLAARVVESYDLEDADPAVLKKVLSAVCDTIRAGGYSQQNGGPADILRELRNAEELYCEVPFAFAAPDAAQKSVVCNGIMDVVYKSAGSWHILDYKTNADGSELDARYAAQLGAYQSAFKATTGEMADARIYHIDI